jgi:uncharacterized membrane protein YcaP (DUF421 family)
METVIKTAIVYVLLLVLMRLAGRRTLGKINTFDLVLVLIIGGATQRALLGQDYSVTNALLVVVTVIVMDVLFSLIERDSPAFSKLVNGTPLIVVQDGQPLVGRLRRARLTADEVLAAARRSHGIYRFEDIKFAILEASGDISIIPAAR